MYMIPKEGILHLYHLGTVKKAGVKLARLANLLALMRLMARNIVLQLIYTLLNRNL